jgi:Flp pilus assembly protein TadD
MSSIGYLTATQITTNCDNMFSAGTNTDDQIEYVTNLAVSRGLEDATDGDYESAINEYKTAISLAPYSDNSFTALEYMGAAYESQGNTGAAIKAYQQAASYFTDEAEPHAKLGLIYFNQGDYESADTEYSKAISLDNTDESTVYSLGEVYLSEKNYTDAETAFKKVTLMAPDDPSGYYSLGLTYRKTGQYDAAVAQLNKAISIDGTYSEAYLELGKTYVDMKQMDEANAQADILSGLDDDEADSSYTELSNYISDAAAPKFTSAYSTNFISSLKMGTLVSSMSSDLDTYGSSHTFTMNFIFSKDMDSSSVENVGNWIISRADGSETGGSYNWGIKTTSSEVSISPIPLSVNYNSETMTAQVTFKITQNSNADGTIDPSHIMFKFSGMDTYGNTMDVTADQYSGMSKIV